MKISEIIKKILQYEKELDEAIDLLTGASANNAHTDYNYRDSSAINKDLDRLYGEEKPTLGKSLIVQKPIEKLEPTVLNKSDDGTCIVSETAEIKKINEIIEVLNKLIDAS